MNHPQKFNSENRPRKAFQPHNINNEFQEYLASLSPEMARQLANATAEALEIMGSKIDGILGTLSPQDLNGTVNIERENMRQLLTSAILTGYLLRSAENRMNYARSLGSLEKF